MRSHAPLPPTEPRQGCERTAQRSPSQARVPTSTTHERKHVCRWEARAGPPAGQSDAPVGTKAHAQGGRGQLPAIQERGWQPNWTYPAKKPNDRTTSRTVVWTGVCSPTSAQATRGRVFDGTSQATRPRHEHARGQQPGTGSWRSSTAPRKRTIAGSALRQRSKHRASIAHAHAHAPAAPHEDGGTPDTPGRPNAVPILAPHRDPTSGPA